MNQSLRKELFVIRATSELVGQWVSAKSIRYQMCKVKKSPTITPKAIGKILQRVGFEKKGLPTQPKMYYINAQILKNRLLYLITNKINNSESL